MCVKSTCAFSKTVPNIGMMTGFIFVRFLDIITTPVKNKYEHRYEEFAT